MGRITGEVEGELVAQTRRMLEEQSDKHLGYRSYLQAWANPDISPASM
jgi:hypothetical protein